MLSKITALVECKLVGQSASRHSGNAEDAILNPCAQLVRKCWTIVAQCKPRLFC